MYNKVQQFQGQKLEGQGHYVHASTMSSKVKGQGHKVMWSIWQVLAWQISR